MTTPSNEQSLEGLIERAKARVAAMTPAELEQMKRDQAASFARSMAPCEHGVVDWEDCPDCRTRALSALKDASE